MSFQLFLDSLPKIKFGFSYGSSYLIAPSGLDSKAQIDLILSVDDTYEWHQENLQRNPSHYSWKVRTLGSKFLVNSSHSGAGVHFNPYVKFGNLTFKYGVIHHKHLIDDLTEWNTFYVAARLQKPVKILQECEEITKLLKVNYKMGLIVGSLLGNSLVHENDLYMNICRLSYLGDRRLEDPKKVYNLVFGNLEKFQEIYRPIIQETKGLSIDNEFVERSPVFYENLKILPEFIRKFEGLDDMNISERHSLIMNLFKQNNSKISTQQILHTLKTGNFWQILKYSFAKFQKSLKNS